MSEIMEQQEVAMERRAKSFNASRMMALAMIKMGMPREDIVSRTGITNKAYANLWDQYQKTNLDALSTELIDTWEMLLRAKLMQTSEKALDVVFSDLECGDTKSAKAASDVFATIFNSFRLSTGKSTENISSASIRFNEIIESRRKLTQPNQSAGNDNVVAI